MSAIGDFYLARADECASEARQTSLSNVRERYLRSEAAWRAMAARISSTEKMRDRNVADKSAFQTKGEVA